MHVVANQETASGGDIWKKADNKPLASKQASKLQIGEGQVGQLQRNGSLATWNALFDALTQRETSNQITEKKSCSARMK